MNTPIKLAFLILCVALTATALVVPPKVSPQHQKAVDGICSVVQDKRLCSITLRSVQSDDPAVLVRYLATAAETSVKKGLKFLAGLKPKYKGNAFATTCITGCEKQLNNALEDFADFWKAAGKNLTSMADNYFTCKKKMTSIFTYHSTCLDDIYDKTLHKVVEGGIGLGKRMSGESVDVFAGMGKVFNTFNIKTKLNQKDTDALLPPPLSFYYY
ncbi:putative pectinesterase/pectinesterase inhibitor [Cardamine amara subsp. amara]|uniref:Pectinesterase/pectinesterase inhibitor n=1 Tax=Cardamine amara subsp. amara TaxID=228776 RepID=A0ABD0ZG00_CARAN